MRLAVRWPWPCAAAESGFSVVGIDVDPSKVDAIREGRSYISDIPSDRLAQVTVNPALAINHSPIHQFTINHFPASALTATTDYSLLAGCDVAIICVPTPLNKTPACATTIPTWPSSPTTGMGCAANRTWRRR